MKTFLVSCLLLVSMMNLAALDQYAELTTLDGKVFKQVKVTRTSPTEIRIMHADGFATIALSALPPEIRVKYGVADPEAEKAAEMQRKSAAQEAGVYQRQEKEAIRIAELSHQSIEVCRQAVILRDWCLANPQGGAFNGRQLDPASRDARLAEAMAILESRPSAAPAVVMTENGAPPPAAVPASGQVPVPQAGFQPGIIELVSARYSLPGNQPRNVKNRLQKLIPTTPISAPVAVLVTDDLSDAAKAQGEVTTAVGVGVSATGATGVTTVQNTPDGIVSTTDAAAVTVGVGVVQSQTTPKNILTVEYLFNGVRYKKQAVEGTSLVLP